MKTFRFSLQKYRPGKFGRGTILERVRFILADDLKEALSIVLEQNPRWEVSMFWPVDSNWKRRHDTSENVSGNTFLAWVIRQNKRFDFV